MLGEWLSCLHPASPFWVTLGQGLLSLGSGYPLHARRLDQVICKGPQALGHGREMAYSHHLLTSKGPQLASGGPGRGAHPTWPLTNLLDCLKDLVLLTTALLKELGMLSLPEF